jgi:hypothetical protein
MSLGRAVVAALASTFAVVGCNGKSAPLPDVMGGPGQVIKRDSGVASSGGMSGTGTGGRAAGSTGGVGGTPATGAGGSTGTGGRVGTGGSGATGGGGRSGGTGGSGPAGGAGGGAGGTGGGGPLSCAECQRTYCVHTTDPIVFSEATIYSAYATCFEEEVLSDYCRMTAVMDPIAGAKTISFGAAAGAKKAEVCQAVLQCMRQSMCWDRNDPSYPCYCGAMSDPVTCLIDSSSRSGACKALIEDAAEGSTRVLDNSSDPCYASGAAEIVWDCHDRYCRVPCLGGTQ